MYPSLNDTKNMYLSSDITRKIYKNIYVYANMKITVGYDIFLLNPFLYLIHCCMIKTVKLNYSFFTVKWTSILKYIVQCTLPRPSEISEKNWST